MSQDNLAKLECSACKQVKYHSHRNKKTVKQKLELKKFCNDCKKHQMMKEVK